MENDNQQQVNVNLTVNGYALDPSMTYIIEVKKSEVTEAMAEGLVNALQQLNIKHVIVATKDGDAFNVVPVPPTTKGATNDEA